MSKEMREYQNKVDHMINEETYAIGPDADITIQQTPDGMGTHIQLYALIRSGGLDPDQLAEKFKKFWKTIDIDA